jgi:ubiquitin carboxyl-terminal hydrolase 8
LQTYIYRLHPYTGKQGDEHFGGNGQQDAGNFLNWLLDRLAEETNQHRHHQVAKTLTKSEELRLNEQDQDVITRFLWDKHVHHEDDSIITRNISGMTLLRKTCHGCGKATKYLNADKWEQLIVPVPEKKQNRNAPLLKYSVRELLHQQFNKPDMRETECLFCCNKKGQTQDIDYHARIARLPPTLIVRLGRVDHMLHKVDTPVRLPVGAADRLDMEPYQLPISEETEKKLGSKFPTSYRLYAFVQHIGASTQQGHYKAFVRGQGSSRADEQWWCYNDQSVTPVNFGGNERLVADVEMGAYLLFFQRVE